MNREDISRLILDAGNGDEEWKIIVKQLHKHFPKELERFAALVASAERERFIGVLRQLHDSYALASDSNAIRARGQA